MPSSKYNFRCFFFGRVGLGVREDAVSSSFSISTTLFGATLTFSTLANQSGLWHADAIERAIAHVEKNEVRRAYDRGIHWEQRVKMADWWAGQLEAFFEVG